MPHRHLILVHKPRKTHKKTTTHHRHGHLVKGSAAALAWGARMRALRRRH